MPPHFVWTEGFAGVQSGRHRLAASPDWLERWPRPSPNRHRPFHEINIALNFSFYIVNVHFNKMQAPLADAPKSTRWVDTLEDEDLSFIKRFVLASGSLKELASFYRISYPTVRLRLDRLIEKVKLLDRQDITSPFERVLRMQHAEGRIDRQTLKLLLDAHQADVARQQDEWGRSAQ
jgi:hypothetical protein